MEQNRTKQNKTNQSGCQLPPKVYTFVWDSWLLVIRVQFNQTTQVTMLDTASGDTKLCDTHKKCVLVFACSRIFIVHNHSNEALWKWWPLLSDISVLVSRCPSLACLHQKWSLKHCSLWVQSKVSWLQNTKKCFILITRELWSVSSWRGGVLLRPPHEFQEWSCQREWVAVSLHIRVMMDGGT